MRDQLKKIDTFAANTRLYNDRITPLAKSTVESTRAGYEIDKSGFLDLITASRNLQQIESANLAQLTEHQIAVAELEAIVGIGNSPSPDASK